MQDGISHQWVRNSHYDPLLTAPSTMVVFIDCGATWCAPGVKKIQSFKELHQHYE